MAIKSKEPNKFYIEQIILSEDNNPEVWSKAEFKDALFQSICKHDKLIGFLFSVRQDVKFGLVKILNMYLIKPNYYDKPEITLDELVIAYNLFLEKVKTETHHNKMVVFKNPPIKQWIDTKENWCKKQATKVAAQFGWDFDEALSEVYYTIMKCYAKEHVYMGNLGYIQTAIFNNVRMCIRYNKNRLNGMSANVESLDQIMFESDEGESISLSDILGYEDENFKRLEYEAFKKEVIDALANSFSPREIDQILKQKAGYLPMNLYKRLTLWRKKHSREEFIR